MAWVYLDDQFPDHPKVVLAGGDAAWLFVCGLAYIKRYGTKGVIPKQQIKRLTDRNKPILLAVRLVEVGLWEEREHDYLVHDYDEWNTPQESRSEAGRKAANARWGNAKRNANASPSHDPPHSESHMRTDANAYASECTIPIPIPIPIPNNTLSSSVLPVGTGPANPVDDEKTQSSSVEQTVRQAAAIAGRRRTERANNVANFDAYAASATRKIIDFERGKLEALAAQGLDAEAIADTVEPAEKPASPRVGAVIDAADTRRRQRAAELPERDDQVNSNGLAAARAELRRASP